MANDATAARAVRQRGERALRRTSELARTIPKPLAIVLAIAILLRLALWVAYRPAVMNFADSGTYIFMADGHWFIDLVRPVGYSVFLAGAHAMSSDLAVTIALQHLLGIATGLLLYATVRRLGAPVWAGVVAAAAVLLSLDQVFFEHTLMAEPLFTLLVTVALYAAVRSLDEPRGLAGAFTSRQGWIIAAGVALGLAAWVRNAGAPMIPFLVIWMALAIPGSLPQRLGRSLLGGVAAGAMVLTYFVLHSESESSHFGFAEGSGRVLYGRVAPFADCTKFDPPAGTSELCETTPPELRSAPDFYTWGKSPAVKAFGPFGPVAGGDEKLGAFARQVIANQPLDYALTVLNDTTRYLAPGFHNRSQFLVADYGYFEIRRRDPVLEKDLLGWHNTYYDDETLRINEDATVILTDLQQLMRVPPVLMLQCLILGAFGTVFARGRVRAGLALLIGAGILLIMIPSATATWNARYAMPANGAFVAAGVVGLWVIVERLLERRLLRRWSGDQPARAGS